MSNGREDGQKLSDEQLHWLGSSFSTFSLFRILGSLILKHNLQLVKEHQQVCGQDGIQDLLAKNWFTRFVKTMADSMPNKQKYSRYCVGKKIKHTRCI